MEFKKVGFHEFSNSNFFWIILYILVFSRYSHMEPLPFIPDQLYKRSDLHDLYGGNRQSGISPSGSMPYIFIFSGKTGKQYGYEDGWDNKDIFSYTGEGQEGDMKFTKGNLALKEHLDKGKRVFLFLYDRPGFVKFESELEFFDVDFFETFDRNQMSRVGIRFFFKRKGARIPFSPAALQIHPLQEPGQPYDPVHPPNVTERSGLVSSRVGQGAYRKSVIYHWNGKCAVTQFDKLEILIASHIVPWAEATDVERLDKYNGILLSPVYDALFDRHLISFDHHGKIMLSESIESSAYERIGVTGKEKIRMLEENNLPYIERHQLLFHSSK